MIYNIISYIFQEDFLPWWLWRNKLLCGEISYGEYPKAKSWGQSPATSQQESETLSLEDGGERIAANNHVSLEVDPSLSWVSDETRTLANTLSAALWDPWARGSAMPRPDSWPTETVR